MSFPLEVIFATLYCGGDGNDGDDGDDDDDDGGGDVGDIIGGDVEEEYRQK